MKKKKHCHYFTSSSWKYSKITRLKFFTITFKSDNFFSSWSHAVIISRKMILLLYIVRGYKNLIFPHSKWEVKDLVKAPIKFNQSFYYSRNIHRGVVEFFFSIGITFFVHRRPTGKRWSASDWKVRHASIVTWSCLT